jgi:hypothetical protein
MASETTALAAAAATAETQPVAAEETNKAACAARLAASCEMAQERRGSSAFPFDVWQDVQTMAEECAESKKWKTRLEERFNRLVPKTRGVIDQLQCHSTFALPDVERVTDLLPELIDIVGQFLSADMKPGQYTSIHTQTAAAASSASSVPASAGPAATAAATTH